MKKFTLLFLLLTVCFGCRPEAEKRTKVLSNLKDQYAGKPINITYTNNSAGVASMSDHYGYTEKTGGEIAFKIQDFMHYKVAKEEDDIFIPSVEHPVEEWNEMVLIESTDKNRVPQRGYVSYKLIKEFSDVAYYDKN